MTGYQRKQPTLAYVEIHGQALFELYDAALLTRSPVISVLTFSSIEPVFRRIHGTPCRSLTVAWTPRGCGGCRCGQQVHWSLVFAASSQAGVADTITLSRYVLPTPGRCSIGPPQVTKASFREPVGPAKTHFGSAALTTTSNPITRHRVTLPAGSET